MGAERECGASQLGREGDYRLVWLQGGMVLRRLLHPCEVFSSAAAGSRLCVAPRPQTTDGAVRASPRNPGS